MKNYRPYLKTVLISILAAIAIDALVNFDQYKTGLIAMFKSKPVTETVNS